MLPNIELAWGAKFLIYPLLVVSTLWLLWEVRKWRHRYVGFGWELGWYGPNKPVQGAVVLSRLLNSPAHKAGIYGQLDETLLSYNGVPMQFDSAKDFKEFFKKERRSLKVGDVRTCMFKRGNAVFEVTMTAETIQGPIPVYLPTAHPSPFDVDYHDYHYGMVVCSRTGYWIPTMRLSDEYFNRLFGKA